jgi:Domain of unknown function (DUF5664)
MSDTGQAVTASDATGARKDDAGKLRYDLIPPHGLAELARIYTEGAAVYSDRNWERGTAWGRYFAAMMRHAWAWWAGGLRHDRGMHHLASVAWYCFALMEYERTQRGNDDRPNKENTNG